MDEKTKQKLEELRDALQDNILPDKYEIIDMFDLINLQNDKLMAIESIVNSIKEEHCTPTVRKDIELILKITQYQNVF